MEMWHVHCHDSRLEELNSCPSFLVCLTKLCLFVTQHTHTQQRERERPHTPNREIAPHPALRRHLPSAHLRADACKQVCSGRRSF